MRKKMLTSGILLVFLGCNPAQKNQENALNYFDLKGYFEKETQRLSKSNPMVTKTVVVNGNAETKKTRIADWSKEFSIFSDADINRSAWKGLFLTKASNDEDVYT